MNNDNEKYFRKHQLRDNKIRKLYREEVLSNSDNYKYLKSLKLVPEKREEWSWSGPSYRVGSSSVVFKMYDEQNPDKFYALKIYLEEDAGRAQRLNVVKQYFEQADSDYLVRFHYYENEFTFEEEKYAVLLMNWVEGNTLQEKLDYSSTSVLDALSRKFDRFALWLIEQPFAHGGIIDLENILVTPENEIKLVDYEGVFVPEFTGMDRPQLSFFEHNRLPNQNKHHFNLFIDDLPLLYLSFHLIVLREEIKAYLYDYSQFFQFIGPQAIETDQQENIELSEWEEERFNELDKSLINRFQSNNRLKSRYEMALKEVGKEPRDIFGLSDLLAENAWVEYESKIQYNGDPVFEDAFGAIYSMDGEKLINAKNLEGRRFYDVREGTKIICDKAFQSSSIEDIYLADSVQAIGKDAFNNCVNLRVANISSPNLKCIKECAFSDCSSLETISLPPEIDYLGLCVFENCTSLKEVTLPKKLRGIPSYAFQGCSSLKHISLPEKIEFIDRNAFENCTSLLGIRIPHQVRFISAETFQYCSQLEVVRFPNELESIYEYAFLECNSLLNINLPDTVSLIAYAAFKGCTSIKKIVFPKGIKEISDGAFAVCTSLEEVVFQKGCADDINVDSRAFSGCSKLKKITIPEECEDLIEIIKDEFEEIELCLI